MSLNRIFGIEGSHISRNPLLRSNAPPAVGPFPRAWSVDDTSESQSPITNPKMETPKSSQVFGSDFTWSQWFEFKELMGHSSAHRVCVKLYFLVGIFIGSKGTQGYTDTRDASSKMTTEGARLLDTIVEKGIGTLAIIWAGSNSGSAWSSIWFLVGDAEMFLQINNFLRMCSWKGDMKLWECFFYVNMS